jgi:hypothetical protein
MLLRKVRSPLMMPEVRRNPERENSKPGTARPADARSVPFTTP